MAASYRLEPVVSVLRLYAGPDNSYEAHSVAEVNVQHVLPGVWCMSAHRGVHNRDTLRALLKAALESGVHTILADRSAGHRLPGAKPAFGAFQLDVLELAKRFRI